MTKELQLQKIEKVKRRLISYWVNIKSKINFLLKSKKYKVIFLIAIFFLGLLITVSRRRDAVTNAQFWAEDGTVWYSEAYNNSNPIIPFLTPHTGYFQTISRIGASVSLLFNMKEAPLVLNLIAICIQVIPVLFFLSSRFEEIVPSLLTRVFLGLLYLSLPNSFETHANITNSQWRLALLLFLIVIAKPAKNKLWKIFDDLFLIIACLSGPFVFLILPIILLHRWFSKYKNNIVQFIIIGSALLIQGISAYITIYITMSAQRSRAPLGASVASFLKLISGQIFISGIFGLSFYKNIYQSTIWNNEAIFEVVGVIGILFLAYVFWKSFLELRLFILFSSLILLTALISPQVSRSNPQWEDMLKPEAGNRYYIFPLLAWIFSLVWFLFRRENKILRTMAGVLVGCILLIGIPSDWKFKPFVDYNYRSQVDKFNALPKGTNFIIDINPPGWNMDLIKK